MTTMLIRSVRPVTTVGQGFQRGIGDALPNVLLVSGKKAKLVLSPA